VLCFDEFSPLEVKPVHGSNWRPMGRPDRIPATYRRNQGVQHLFAVYDMKDDRLITHMKQRKWGREFLGFLRYVRMRYLNSRVLGTCLSFVLVFGPGSRDKV
jgi:hypothetical protein